LARRAWSAQHVGVSTWILRSCRSPGAVRDHGTVPFSICKGRFRTIFPGKLH
jgi:hypothetical protein